MSNTPRAHNAVDPLASRYAHRLLADLDVAALPAEPSPARADPDRWRQSGLAALTGDPGAAVEDCPVPVASLADGALEALRLLAGSTILPRYNGAELLTLRAAMTGLTRRGAISPGGSCRILPCADGHVAVNLARESDWDARNAWLQAPTAANWTAVAAALHNRTTRDLVEQARLLGLAVVDAGHPAPGGEKWFEARRAAAPVQQRSRPARVIDLSSLWAGPLCGLLLGEAGCEVIKVEGSGRPDGARNGAASFFDFLNGAKQQRSLPLHLPRGRAQLLELLRGADIVIEGSRPRALRQMGIHAEQLLAEVPGLTWLSITGYGREEPGANWIAYGDDAGVAAGLSALLHRSTGRWLFCGDAIADPFTGMHAAVAALAGYRNGGGRLLSLSLVQTLQHGIGFARATQVQ